MTCGGPVGLRICTFITISLRYSRVIHRIWRWLVASAVAMRARNNLMDLQSVDLTANVGHAIYFNENIALFTIAIETIKGLRGETE